MGTIRDYYESGSKEMNVQNKLSLFNAQGVEIGQTIEVKIHFLIEAHSKYISMYRSEGVAYDALLVHLNNPTIINCDQNALLGQSEKMEMDISVNEGDTVSVKDLNFSRKIIIYSEVEVSETELNRLKEHGKSNNLSVEVRDCDYAERRSKKEKPLAFVSHSKKDSRDLAMQLTNELSRLGCPVWFDEFSLSIGDSLTDSIEKGLKETDRCIFILSPEFLSDQGWCKHEFKTASMKQIIEKKSVMLPIWHGVQKESVYEYSAALVDIVGISTDSKKVDEIAKEIAKVLRK